MSEQNESLEERTERFGFEVMQAIQGFPPSEPAQTIKRQLAKSASSVGANYRALRRSRSHNECTSRVGVVAEEADESHHWLRQGVKLGFGDSRKMRVLVNEADELTAIFSAMVRTARHNARTGKYRNRDR